MGDGTPGAGPTVRPVDDYPELYTQVCESYRAIDDFRMKLLRLLPVATGAGVLVLLNSGKVNLGAKDQELERIQHVLAGVAIFGVAITLGLFAYELHGIKKCGRLIKIGARIESDCGGGRAAVFWPWRQTYWPRLEVPAHQQAGTWSARRAQRS